MTANFARHPLTLLLVVIMLVLSGCASTRVDSPTGVWIASGDAHGTLRIDDDGTFTITNASFNPVQNRPASNNDFEASGTWRLRDDSVLLLHFERSTQAGTDTGRIIIPQEYASGTIRFEDPEQTGSIDFRLSSEDD